MKGREVDGYVCIQEKGKGKEIKGIKQRKMRKELKQNIKGREKDGKKEIT